MTRTIGGVLHRIDSTRCEVVIGGETFDLLPGMPVPPELLPGTGVVALVTERDGARQVVHLRPNAVPRYIASGDLTRAAG